MPDTTELAAIRDYQAAQSRNIPSIYFPAKSEEEVISGMSTTPDYAKNFLRQRLLGNRMQGVRSGGPVAGPQLSDEQRYKIGVIDRLTRQSRPSMSSGRMVGGVQMEPSRAFASLQMDEDYRQLDEDSQRSVLQSVGGTEAVRLMDIAKAAQKKKALDAAEYENQPTKMIQGMLNRGDLRVDPAQGLMQKTRDSAGQEVWDIADPFTVQNAEKAWPVLYGGNLPMNDKQAKAIQMYRSGIPKDKVKAFLMGGAEAPTSGGVKVVSELKQVPNYAVEGGENTAATIMSFLQNLTRRVPNAVAGLITGDDNVVPQTTPENFKSIFKRTVPFFQNIADRSLDFTNPKDAIITDNLLNRKTFTNNSYGIQ